MINVGSVYLTQKKMVAKLNMATSEMSVMESDSRRCCLPVPPTG